MANALAEAGVRVVKYDELALPHKPNIELRLDEYIEARIPKREAQCRLLVTRVKANLVRKRKQVDDISATGVCRASQCCRCQPSRRICWNSFVLPSSGGEKTGKCNTRGLLHRDNSS